eukprot:2957182-Pyramimonas_sp.AAC.1
MLFVPKVTVVLRGRRGVGSGGKVMVTAAAACIEPPACITACSFFLFGGGPGLDRVRGRPLAPPRISKNSNRISQRQKISNQISNQILPRENLQTDIR